MIGTTHFTNAVVERRDLQQVGALAHRPARQRQPAAVHRLAGGSRRTWCAARCTWSRAGMSTTAARSCRSTTARSATPPAAWPTPALTAVGVTAVFSPLTAECEQAAGRILAEEIPDAGITLSHELGRIGLLERENVTLLNACLQDLARADRRGLRRGVARQRASTRRCI